jgi:hypothetical protein
MRTALLFVFFAVGVFAQTVFPFGGTISHLADGGGILTVITLVNLEDGPATYTLRFRDDSGTDLPLATDAGTGSAFSGTLPAHGSRTISTTGTSLLQVQGWAAVETSNVIGGSALYRVLVAPWAGAEATLPIDTGINKRFALSFDQTTGAANGLALANPSPFETLTVFFTIKDQGGNQYVLDSFTMAPYAHRSFVIGTKYPATLGQRGTVEVSTTGFQMSVLALRFSGASITSVLPFVNWLW